MDKKKNAQGEGTVDEKYLNGTVMKLNKPARTELK